ncbi:choice-of-anchor I family protein [Cyanobacterium sp. IPPAS B-1200]|uniref:choice-of-anchor I family protein n=1 Tax=Cyanobacterium sp. IPPAS B-1200 TaxID=1562720 RepID=UPI0008528AFB|nr:choice-of-anchor I family protein [Cyanobacterium sp. IPPAS B-1200]OEJ79380.1 hypothetical protein A5482_00525 [Cyanobacterium sp. IPPAS B-1200]
MTINLNRISTYNTGIFDESAAEIPAYDPTTQRLFVVNAQSASVDVLDLSDPTQPTKVGEIVGSSLGGVINSVTIKNGIVAIALEANVKTDPGSIILFNSDSDFSSAINPIASFGVGALPDMVTFTPDGTKILVANEGEPNDYNTEASIDPEGSISIIDISNGIANATVTTADFNAFDDQKDQLIDQGVRIFGPNATVSQDLEPEYITVSADSGTAYVALQENNALAVVDIASSTVTNIIPLGFKDHSLVGNELDASNRDDVINIRNWPVKGMFQPDAIASYTVDGMNYIVTANEGDARDYDNFSEEARVGDLNLDPTVFPNAAQLQENSQLGRLNITTTLGDADGDGIYEEIYAYGARSFSIWDENGNLVFDSGSEFENIVAQQIPEYFNSNNDDNDSFDARSDDKGPEPEGVTIGEINGTPYAFIGLERVGGIMVYDISDPTDAQFVQYINNRDFTVDAQLEDGSSNPAAGDLGPEGLVFISADDSPNGVPLLVVSSEVSGSTSVYEIEPKPFTLQILHASDQEAGIPALQDAIGFSAVMNALDAGYDNTLKLTSGDLFIAGPFFNASGELYGQQGIADILIQNALGWDAAAVGNHEFDAGPGAFYNAIAPDFFIDGVGIDPETGYEGALFPYLATNLDYSTDSSDLKDLVVESGQAPQPNSLSESVVIDVNGEEVGVIGAVVPYLPQIAGIGGITMLTNPTSRDIEVNAQLLADNIQPFVDELVNQGINKIVLMTHLQQFEIEQALATKLTDVDIIMGGGSNRVMANDDDILRQDETQVAPELLQPYPQVFQDAEGNDVYLVNTGGNYRYLGQLIIDFDSEGQIIEIGDDSGTFATDIAGVDRLYEEDITTFEQVRDFANQDLVAVVDNVGNFINGKDGTIFGNTEVYLNGLRSSVRAEETNLGNLTADANLWYAEQYGFDIDISVKNGGGIRDQIGLSFIEGGTNELVQLPPQANPAVGKEEGDISVLDIENSLRFDNKLSVADISAQGIKDLAEHFVAQWAEGATPGQFGQIGGFSFSFDPDNTAIEFTRDGSGNATGVAVAGERIRNLVLNREDGTQEAIVINGELVVDPNSTYKMAILDFLATGGDGYPAFYFENVVTLDSLTVDNLPSNSDLPIGREQDALAEYLAEFHPDADRAFNQADTPIEEDTRIQNLNFRNDSLINNSGSGGGGGGNNNQGGNNIDDNVSFTVQEVGNGEGIVINLSQNPQNVTVRVEDNILNRTEASFHNIIGLYQVQNVNGAIIDTFDSNNNGSTNDLLNPGDEGYAFTAVSNAVNNFNLELGANGDPNKNTNADAFGDALLQGGRIYAPFIITNAGNLIPDEGSIRDGMKAFLELNPSNVGATLENFDTDIVAYFSYLGANPDNSAHIRSLGNNIFGFEDLPGNLGVSDFDFNDAVVRFAPVV